MDKSRLIIASDLDGTLLDSSTNVSKENLDSIKALSENGINTIVLTGRTFHEIPKELRECGCIDYFIYSNGAGINHKDNGIIDYNPISDDLAIKVFNILSEYESFIEVYSNFVPYAERAKYNDDSFEYYNIDKSFIPEMHKSRVPAESLISLVQSSEYKIEMFDVFFRHIEQRDECQNRLKKEFDSLEFVSSMANNLEIMKKGINKGTGLMTLCRIAGLDIENILAIGDSKNDISAFNVAGMKYAVSNACYELKNIADKIICSNDENVMCYMEKYIKGH